MWPPFIAKLFIATTAPENNKPKKKRKKERKTIIAMFRHRKLGRARDVNDMLFDLGELLL